VPGDASPVDDSGFDPSDDADGATDGSSNSDGLEPISTGCVSAAGELLPTLGKLFSNSSGSVNTSCELTFDTDKSLLNSVGLTHPSAKSFFCISKLSSNFDKLSDTLKGLTADSGR
jgi:hypothetical protein